jgi:CCR4-NOT transcription complex subunit 1
MEVALYTLRKLIKQHASRIFGNDNSSDPTGSWTVLSNEVEAIRSKPDQAKKIADAIDINEGEPFRDFDLSTFMERFKLDPVAKCMLALSLKSASKSDLKTKCK